MRNSIRADLGRAKKDVDYAARVVERLQQLPFDIGYYSGENLEYPSILVSRPILGKWVNKAVTVEGERPDSGYILEGYKRSVTESEKFGLVTLGEDFAIAYYPPREIGKGILAGCVMLRAYIPCSTKTMHTEFIFRGILPEDFFVFK